MYCEKNHQRRNRNLPDRFGGQGYQGGIRFCYWCNTGLHNFANSFAIAVLGCINEDGDFDSEVWSESEVRSKRAVGLPKTYDTWDDEGESEELDWGGYQIWIDSLCARWL